MTAVFAATVTHRRFHRAVVTVVVPMGRGARNDLPGEEFSAFRATPPEYLPQDAKPDAPDEEKNEE